MASVKVKFRPSSLAGKQGVIYYQIICKRVVRQVKTDYKIFQHEWDAKASKITISETENARQARTKLINERIRIDLSKFTIIIKSLDYQGDYSAHDIVETFEKQPKGISILIFMQSIIMRLGELNKYRTLETYKTTLSSFMKFSQGEDILISDISSDMMLDYQAYLKNRGLKNNTISFYMRVLRAVYSRAVEQELIEHKSPFKKVYTGVDKTQKRALTLKDIKKIKKEDSSLPAEVDLARDMFLFSFYTRGMSFVDMAYLRKSDLKYGILSYRRRKTGQLMNIKWEDCMQDIIQKYNNPDSEYLLPIIRRKDKDERAQYINKLSQVNKNLKILASTIGITTHLTLYVARHSWASIAQSRNIPISVISEAMGHESQATTQIYLASIDSSLVDKANNLILKLL